jgi:hypothetical protein
VWNWELFLCSLAKANIFTNLVSALSKNCLIEKKKKWSEVNEVISSHRSASRQCSLLSKVD